jgi:hypothetical protein
MADPQLLVKPPRFSRCVSQPLLLFLSEADEHLGWLGWWATQYSLRDVVDVGYYLGWYAAITMFIVMT